MASKISASVVAVPCSVVWRQKIDIASGGGYAKLGEPRKHRICVSLPFWTAEGAIKQVVLA